MPQLIIGLIVIVLVIYAIGFILGAILATVGFIGTNVILFIERAFFIGSIIPPVYSWGIIGLITGISMAAYKEAPRYGKGGLQPWIVIIPVLIIFINGAYNHKNTPQDLASSSTSRILPQPPTRAPVSAPKAPSINITKAVVASGLGTNQVPVGIDTNFNSGNKRLYYYISYNGAIAHKTVVTFKWYKNKYKIRESKFTLHYASGNVWNYLDYDFQPGQYEIQVYANGQQLARTSFVARSTTPERKSNQPKPKAAAKVPVASQPLIAANGDSSLSISDIKIECWGNDLTDGKIGGWKSNYPHCILDDGGGDANAIYEGELSFEGNKLYITMKNLQTKAPPMHTLSVGFLVTLRRGTFSDGSTYKIVKMSEFNGWPNSRPIQKTFDIRNLSK